VGEGEDREQRLNRELIELLNELRVALPGVQVLFAFMLTVPFSQGWGQITDLQRRTFIVALLAISCATAFLMSPTAYHRVRWRQRDKERMLRTSNRLAIGGLALLAFGLATVVFLVMDVVIVRDTALAVAAAAPIAVLIASLWFGLPLFRRARDDDPGERSERLEPTAAGKRSGD
jgi:amino acid transporter